MTTSAPEPWMIDQLDEALPGHDAIFCDIWGVLHNGVRKFPPAEAALRRARQTGRPVVLITNSPRRSADVVAQLDLLGVTPDAYDHVVTSGDATRDLIASADGALFHLGPERDLGIFDDLGKPLANEAAADVVVATGLFDDEAETAADYGPLLRRLAERDLPMICANPDIVVHRGERLIDCAGALARDYVKLGGKVRLAGKPHRPIYELAAKRIGGVAGKRILAIGDGLMTDIRGANDFGAEALLVLHGIHEAEFGGADASPARIAAALEGQGLSARYMIPVLR